MTWPRRSSTLSPSVCAASERNLKPFRRSARHQARTCSISMDIHQESSTVASVAQAHHAEVVAPGHMGSRHCALANRLRQLQSRVHRIFVYEAGPCGDRLSRSLTTKRLAKGTKPIQELRWQTQVRLGPRERPRSTREQTPNPVVVAMARELRAFLWASAQDVPRTPATTTVGSCAQCSEGLRRPSAETQPRCGVARGGVQRRQEPSSLERGRPLTNARQGGHNPRIAARSPVVSSWLRLCRGASRREKE